MYTSGKLLLVLVLPLSIAGATRSLVTREPSQAELTEIRGQGPKAAVACMGCVAAAGLVVAAGPAVIIAALWQPGGALAVAGCVAICAEALN